MSWREQEAAAVLRQCHAAFAADGASPLALAAGSGDIAEWRHFPAGDFYDPASHAQYFYHRHSAAAAASGLAEHGHFHLFLRAAGMPPGISPLVLPELAVANAPPFRQSSPQPRGAHDPVCHLVALALDARGMPVRLFTTNRWVTGETWYAADDVIRMLDRFLLCDGGPEAWLNRWLAALVRLYQADIAELLRRRDRTIAEWRWRRRGNAFEDGRLEIASALDIDLAARIAAAENHASDPAIPGRAPRRDWPPSMADGWGR